MRTTRLVTLLLPVMLLAGGCSDQDPPAEDAGSAAAPSTSASASPTASATPSAEAISADDVPAGTVAATYPGPAGGSTVRLQALPLEVRGELATLTVLWTPTFPGASATQKISLYEMNSKQPVYASLVDTENLKRHNVVKDSSGIDLSTEEVGTGSVSGSPVASRYTFAAPADGVTSVDAYVGSFPPLADVPVKR